MGRRVNDLEVGAGISSSREEGRGVAVQPQGQLGAWRMGCAAPGEGGAPSHRAAAFRLLQPPPRGSVLQYLESIIQGQAFRRAAVTSEAGSSVFNREAG